MPLRDQRWGYASKKRNVCHVDTARRGMRDSHLLGRRLLERLSHAVIPERGGSILLRKPQSTIQRGDLQ